MKKIISCLAIIVVCMTMSVNTYAEGAETKDSPLFSDQYIAYYTETNEMKIYAFKSEKKALEKDVEKLQGQEMYRVTKGGKIGRPDYWKRTNESTDMYYVGKLKDNKPTGNGILYQYVTATSLGLSNDITEYYYIRVYEGNFKDGVESGFGRAYNAPTEELEVAGENVEIEPIALYQEVTQDRQQNIFLTVNPLCYEGYFKNNKYSGKGNKYEYPVLDMLQYYSDILSGDDGQYNNGNSYSDSRNSEYLISDSDKRVIDESDLNGLSSSDIQMAINEIYARHGRLFQDSTIQAYFNEKSWYYGNIPPEEFSDNMLSEIEKKNIQQLAQWRDNDVSYEQVVPNQELILNDNDAAAYFSKHIMVWSGKFKKGKENGKVKLYCKGDLLYEGDMRKGNFNGKGTAYFPNSNQIQYEGEWKKNKYDGIGTLYNQSGEIEYEGKWENGDYAD